MSNQNQQQDQLVFTTILEQQQQANLDFVEEGLEHDIEHGRELRASAQINPDPLEFLPGFRHGQST